MKVLLFGISNVGKTTVGKILAKKLDYKFVDLDDVIKEKFNSIEEFQKNYPFQYEAHKIKGKLLKDLCKENNSVIAVSPIYYSRNFNDLLKNVDVIAFELQDSPKNIFERLIFTDEFDNVCEDSKEYKNKHKEYYLNDIKEDILYYKKAFIKIDNKYNVDGRNPEYVAEQIYKIISKNKIQLPRNPR